MYLVGDWTLEEAEAHCDGLDEGGNGCLMADYCDGSEETAACVDYDVDDMEGYHQITFSSGVPENICTSYLGDSFVERDGEWPSTLEGFEE